MAAAMASVYMAPVYYVLLLRFLPLAILSISAVTGWNSWTAARIPIYYAPNAFRILLLLAAIVLVITTIPDVPARGARLRIGILASLTTSLLSLTIFTMHFAMGYRNYELTLWLVLFAASSAWIVVLSRVWVLSVSVVLLPFGSFTLVLGITDTFDAEAVASQLFGVALVVASAVMLGVSVWLVCSLSAIMRTGSVWLVRSNVRPLALVASIVGLSVALMMLIVQLSGFDRDLRITLWIGIVVAFGVCVLLLLRTGARVKLKLASVATVISTLIGGGLLQLWYTNQYLPAAVKPAVSVVSSIEKVGSLRSRGNRGTLALLIKTSAKNISTTRIILLGGMVRVWGIKQPPNAVGTDAETYAKDLLEAGRQKPNKEHPNPGNPASRFAADATSEVIYAIPWYHRDNKWLDPNHEGMGQATVYVARNKYDLVTVEAEVWYARADRLLTGSSIDERESRKGLEAVRQLRETSLTSRITRRQRYVHQIWWVKEPRVEVCVNQNRWGRGGVNQREYASKMNGVYGISASYSGTASLSLWEVPDSSSTEPAKDRATTGPP
jgi:hypothetical protein